MILHRQNPSVTPVLLTNLTFAFFPVSFILGNLFINLNLLLFCCFGVFHLRSKILKTEYEYPIKIIFLFFFLIFFSTSLSFIKFLYFEGYEHDHFVRFLKSVTFFRFFLGLVLIYLLSKHNILNFKYFLITASFFPILVSLDVIFQYFVGFNIIGLENFDTYVDKSPIPGSEGKYNTSFFGNEKIAGGFIQNFSFFSILFLFFKLKDRERVRFVLISSAICVLALGILLSGNRMPLLLFFIGLLLLFLFGFSLKKIISTSLIGIFIIFSFIFSIDEDRKKSFKSSYLNLLDIRPFDESSLVPYSTSLAEDKDIVDDFEFFWITPDTVAGHTKLIFTALDLWERNKIFGNGIKSFRLDCEKLEAHQKNRLCSNHPHNYYIEILAETGLAGFFVIFVIGLLFIFFVSKNFKLLRRNNIENLILLASIISIALETLPFRSTGSIFTTYNATYLMLIGSILFSYKKKLTT